MQGEHAPGAWILSVGNELLVGRVENTNATWLARRLTFAGFRVERVVVVPDDVDSIAEEVGRCLGRARVLVTTGGLGPTHDDVTLEGISRALGEPLEVNEEALRMLGEFYSARGMELTGERVKMARMPRGCRPLPNPVGAAPGCAVEGGGTLIVALPGVPGEMMAMYEAHVEGVLRELAPGLVVVECGLEVRGVPESSLAPALREISRRRPRAYVKSHPRGHEALKPVIEVKVMSSASTREEALGEARRVLEEVAREAEALGGEVRGEPCS